MTTPSQSFTPQEEDRLYGRVMWRILPFLFLLYIFAYLDRVNVSFAKLQMLADLKWSDAIYGLGAGMFYLGYAAFGPPSNMMVFRFGARRWLAFLMIVWGIFSTSMMFIHVPWHFYSLRFLVGAAEAGFYPGVGLYFLKWFPLWRRGRVISRLAMALPISGVLGGPASGKIMEAFHEVHGLTGWKWLFLLEGLPSVVLGITVLYVLCDSIAQAKWLSQPEKDFLQANLGKGPQAIHDLTFWQVCAHPSVWYVGLTGFCGSAAAAGLSFWLPQIIRNCGVGNVFYIGLLSALPYVAALALLIIVGNNTDRTGRRTRNYAVCMCWAALGVLLVWFSGYQPELCMLGLTIAVSGSIASTPVLSVTSTEYLAGKAGASGFGLMNSISCIGGFLSPYLIGFLETKTHSLVPCFIVVSASFFVAAIFIYILRPAPPGTVTTIPPT